MVEESRLPPVAVNCSALPQNLLRQDGGGNTLSLCKGIVSVTLLTCALCCQCSAAHNCLLAALPGLSADQRAGPWQVPGSTSFRLQKSELSQWGRVTLERGCPLLGTGFSPSLSADIPLSLTKTRLHPLMAPALCVT